MEQHRVRHGDIADPATSSALREYAEDRDNIRARLTEQFLAEESIRSAWMWGSFGRDDGDDLSDLDIWLAVDDASMPTISAVLTRILPKAGEWLLGGENPNCAPANGSYIGARYAARHGAVHLDLYWQSVSSIDKKPDVAVQLKGFASTTELRPIFDRMADLMPHDYALRDSSTPVPHHLDPIAECVNDGLDFMTLMLPIAAKKLARCPLSDMSLALYPRPGFTEAVKALDAVDIIGAVNWEPPADPIDKIGYLRKLALNASCLAEYARERGISCSESDRLLGDYLQMVEGIVRSRVSL